MSSTALILVDLQYDFLPGGALAVPHGDQVLPIARALMTLRSRFDAIVATQDWHPPDHISFASNHEGMKPGQLIEVDGHSQVLWPVHCVQGSPGAEIATEISRDALSAIFPKGMDHEVDSYSGFYDNDHRRDTGLADWLRERGVDTLYVMGLATDYCVKYTVLDALSEGFNVYLIEDGCRGVELTEGDIAHAIEVMKEAGVRVIQSAQVV